MLSTNSKEFKSKIRKYIMDGFDSIGFGYDEYKNVDSENFSCVAHAIFDCFYKEKIKHDSMNKPRYFLFQEWCSGLCNMINTSYYYNVSAVELLGDWMEQTKEERNKYTESQAEERITQLLCRELKKGCRFF